MELCLVEKVFVMIVFIKNVLKRELCVILLIKSIYNRKKYLKKIFDEWYLIFVWKYDMSFLNIIDI